MSDRLRVPTVLHVNDYRHGGGAEVLMHTLVNAQRDRGISAAVFTIEDVPGYQRSWRNYISNHRACAALRSRLDQVQPSIVHLHNFYHALSPAILCTLAEWRRMHPEVRVVMTAHDHHLLCPNSGLRYFQGANWRVADPARMKDMSYLLSRSWDHRGWAHSCMKLAQHLWHYRVHHHQRVIDCVLAPSNFMARPLREAGFDVEVVPNPAPNPQHCRKGNDRLHIVFAGRIEPEKGVAEFLEAVPAIQNCRVTIIGDGAAASSCIERCAQLGLTDRVCFTGALPHDQTMQRISEAHLLALPSLAPESAGLTLLEALARGTNILTSFIGGSGEIVRDSGVGYLFTPGDQASLCTALQAAHRDFTAGTLNGFDASDYLAQRRVEVIERQIAAVYQQMLATQMR